MSHCTKFNFQYVDKDLIRKVFDALGVKCKKTVVRTNGSMTWIVGEYPLLRFWRPKHYALMAKYKGFNLFMIDFGKYYKLSVEKHDMTWTDKLFAKNIEHKCRKEYVKLAAKLVVDDMRSQGHDATLLQNDEEFAINFGATHEKNISIRFDNDSDSVIENVQGVKGKSCVSLTETLENLLSSPDVALHSSWTEEYYQNEDDNLSLYEMNMS